MYKGLELNEYLVKAKIQWDTAGYIGSAATGVGVRVNTPEEGLIRSPYVPRRWGARLLPATRDAVLGLPPYYYSQTPPLFEHLGLRG